MKSRISIEYDFDHAEPFIKVVCDRSTDDMRDRMLQHFFEMCVSENTLNFVYDSDVRSEDGDFIKSNYRTLRIFPTKSKIAKAVYPSKPPK